MNSKCDKIEDLVDEIKAAGINFDSKHNGNLEKLKQILNKKNCAIWLTNHAKLSPLFINDAGKKYMDVESNDLSGESLDWFLKRIHPEDMPVVHRCIAKIESNPTEVCNSTYRLKNFNNEWRWLYCSQIALNTNDAGMAEYMIIQIYDIEDLIQAQPGNKADDAYLQKLEKYNTLTTREKQILNMVAEEMTSQEIAERLFIETSTVHTHRKHIISKLNAKSSLGLVKYALFFSQH